MYVEYDNSYFIRRPLEQSYDMDELICTPVLLSKFSFYHVNFKSSVNLMLHTDITETIWFALFKNLFSQTSLSNGKLLWEIYS